MEENFHIIIYLNNPVNKEQRLLKAETNEAREIADNFHSLVEHRVAGPAMAGVYSRPVAGVRATGDRARKSGRLRN